LINQKLKNKDTFYNDLITGKLDVANLDYNQMIKIYKDFTDFIKNDFQIKFCDLCKNTNGLIYTKSKSGWLNAEHCCVAKLSYIQDVLDIMKHCIPKQTFEKYSIEDYVICGISEEFMLAFLQGGLKKNWFYLYGNVGTGKTYTSLVISILAILQRKNVVFRNIVSLLESFRYDQNNALALKAQCIECDLLILDDFGKSTDTDFSVSMIFDILAQRDLRNSATIITSNYSVEDMPTHEIDINSIISRIKANSIIVPFKDEDKRLLYSKL